MGCKDDLIQIQQGIPVILFLGSLVEVGLYLLNVQGGSGHMTRYDGIIQGLLVQHTAAGHIDNAHALLAELDLAFANEVLALGSLGNMQGHQVGLL